MKKIDNSSYVHQKGSSENACVYGKKARVLISLLFFLTGFSSLTFQMAWRKVLTQTVGVDYISATLIVAIFMLGLGLGGHFGSIVTKKYKNSIFIFFMAEVIIAIFGFFSILLLRKIPVFIGLIYSGIDAISFILDFSFNFLVLLPPTILMGMSLPIVTHTFRNIYPPGSAVGFLYSINIIGAAIGAFISGVFLVGIIGITWTTIFAGVINIGGVLLVASVVLSKLNSSLIDGAHERKLKNKVISNSARVSLHRRLTYLVSFGIGFIALAYEILFYRLLVCYFSATSYVFPIVLTAYLCLMGLGNYLVGKTIKKGYSLAAISWVLTIGLILTSVFVFMVSFTPNNLTYLFTSKIIFDQGLGFGVLLIDFIIALIFMLPVLFVSGFFPVFIHSLTHYRENLGFNVGRVYLIQTLGNFSGTILSGIVLIPILGSVTYMKFMVCAVLGISVTYYFIILRDKYQISKITEKIFIGFALISLIPVFTVNPSKFFKSLYLGSKIRVSEELEGTVLIQDKEGASRVHVGLSPATSYSRIDIPYDLWPIDVATTLIGKKDPERVLIIGIGPGQQALVLHKLYPNAEITIVELLDIVIREMKQYGSPKLKELLNSPKVHIYITDGRRFINKMKKKNAIGYDLIQVGVFHVTSAGAGNLFTREMLQDYKKILSPTGVLTFNAYLPSIRPGQKIFKNIVIASRGEGKVADSFLLKNEYYPIEKFSIFYNKNRKKIINLIEKNGLQKDINCAIYSDAFLVFKKESMEAGLKNVSSQFDDRVVTEYFLTSKTTWDKTKAKLKISTIDPRLWEKNSLDIFFRDMVCTD